MSNIFEAEKYFLDRKLLVTKVEWEIISALSQLISPPIVEEEAKKIVSQLKDALSKKALVAFPKMVFTVNSKLRGGLRVAVSVPLLREFFADEIDRASGSGGRKLNPLQTTFRPGGRR